MKICLKNGLWIDADLETLAEIERIGAEQKETITMWRKAIKKEQLSNTRKLDIPNRISSGGVEETSKRGRPKKVDITPVKEIVKDIDEKKEEKEIKEIKEKEIKIEVAK